jgi:predicted outer membrane protein
MSNNISIVLAALMLPITLLQAQNEPHSKPATPPATAATAAAKLAAPSDAILASWLHVGSTNEVALAQLALKQAQHADVRAFAQKMVDDHTAWAAQLQPMTVGAGKGSTKDGGADGGVADRGRNDRGDVKNPDQDPAPASKAPKDASSPRGQTAAGEFDHVALIRDLGKKCLQSATEMLRSKSPAEFDRCYMSLQVASHVRSADMIEVFKSYASPALLPTLQAGQKTIAAHLDHAKTLCKQVDDKAIGANSRSGNPPRDGR